MSPRVYVVAILAIFRRAPLTVPRPAVSGDLTRAIGQSLLTTYVLPFEIAWLNAYHARIRREIEPVLLSDDRAWLRHATAPIG